VAKRVQKFKRLMIVFEDRQLALGGGIQLTSLWVDIVLWGQLGLY